MPKGYQRITKADMPALLAGFEAALQRAKTVPSLESRRELKDFLIKLGVTPAEAERRTNVKWKGARNNQKER